MSRLIKFRVYCPRTKNLHDGGDMHYFAKEKIKQEARAKVFAIDDRLFDGGLC